MRRTSSTIAEPIEYVEIRLEQLRAEQKKNPEKDTQLMFDKCIYELTIVLDLLKRNKLLSMNPMS